MAKYHVKRMYDAGADRDVILVGTPKADGSFAVVKRCETEAEFKKWKKSVKAK